jgi:hypothetical protein
MLDFLIKSAMQVRFDLSSAVIFIFIYFIGKAIYSESQMMDE